MKTSRGFSQISFVVGGACAILLIGIAGFVIGVGA
jgi:hypothetical protein